MVSLLDGDTESLAKYERFLLVKNDENYRECPSCQHGNSTGSIAHPSIICGQCQATYCYIHARLLILRLLFIIIIIINYYFHINSALLPPAYRLLFLIFFLLPQFWIYSLLSVVLTSRHFFLYLLPPISYPFFSFLPFLVLLLTVCHVQCSSEFYMHGICEDRRAR